MIVDHAVKKLVQRRLRVAKLFALAINSAMRALKVDGTEKVLIGLIDLKVKENTLTYRDQQIACQVTKPLILVTKRNFGWILGK